MANKHIHRCHACGDSLYVCREPVQRDDCGSYCANAMYGEREYCENCCVQDIESDVDEAMHDNDNVPVWAEGR